MKFSKRLKTVKHAIISNGSASAFVFASVAVAASVCLCPCLHLSVLIVPCPTGPVLTAHKTNTLGFAYSAAFEAPNSQDVCKLACYSPVETSQVCELLSISRPYPALHHTLSFSPSLVGAVAVAVVVVAHSCNIALIHSYMQYKQYIHTLIHPYFNKHLHSSTLPPLHSYTATQKTL